MVVILQINKYTYEARVPVTVFELAGEIESITSEQFQKEVQQAIEAGACYVLLDMSRLRHIGSAGLRALHSILKALSAKGRVKSGGNGNTGSFKSPYLKLYNPSPAVYHALDVMGFNMSMEIHDNLDKALSSF